MGRCVSMRSTPGAFTPVSTIVARGILQTWADQFGNPSTGTQAALASNIFGPLEDADSIFRLPSLADGSPYESGWIVGQSCFHEFIAIDRGGKRLNVIVASDDEDVRTRTHRHDNS